MQECSVPKDSPFSIQPPTSVPSHSINTESLRGPLEISPSPLHQTLQHQSKSFPPRLQRTPSISSQSSLDSAPSRHSVSSEVSSCYGAQLSSVKNISFVPRIQLCFIYCYFVWRFSLINFVSHRKSEKTWNWFYILFYKKHKKERHTREFCVTTRMLLEKFKTFCNSFSKTLHLNNK